MSFLEWKTINSNLMTNYLMFLLKYESSNNEVSTAILLISNVYILLFLSLHFDMFRRFSLFT